MSLSPQARLQSAEETDQRLESINESLEEAGEELEDLIDGVSEELHPVPHAILSTARRYMVLAAQSLEQVNQLNQDYAAEAAAELENQATERSTGEHRNPVVDQVERIMANLGVGESALLVIRKAPHSEESNVGEVFH